MLNYESKSDEKDYYELFLPTTGNYSFNGIDGDKLRNFTAMINWGFPNIGAIPFCNKYERIMFMLIDKIQPGEELLINYGTGMIPTLYASRFVLLNKKKMLEHFSSGFNFRSNEMEVLLTLVGSQEPMAQAYITNNYLKLSYLMEVPAAYIYMHAKGLFNIVDVFVKQNFWANILEKDNPFAFKFSLLVKNFFEIFENNLAEKSDLKQKIYDFIIEYVEEISVIQLLHVLERMHVLIKKNELILEKFEETKKVLLKDINGYKWEQDKNHPLSIDKYFGK